MRAVSQRTSFAAPLLADEVPDVPNRTVVDNGRGCDGPLAPPRRRDEGLLSPPASYDPLRAKFAGYFRAGDRPLPSRITESRRAAQGAWLNCLVRAQVD